jgi:hypothetical protein
VKSIARVTSIKLRFDRLADCAEKHRLLPGAKFMSGKIAFIAGHVLRQAATTGEALRTYEMDLAGGKPVAVGPVGFSRIHGGERWQAHYGQERSGRGSSVE